ncbi:MAG: hypothetical protein B6U88_02650 [Candidatus Aenigmarchaeota archaeon ex4484_56]|nr:MAG: hypothetical protein B6U88_02650 [Candidatus Aenigmarchaeota archaeon ex4484_56]
MTITISENTKRIRKFGETKIKKLPYPSTPISYFGNLDCANSYIDKISIPNSDLNRLINLFPKNTNDYDALICCDEPEIQNYLTENGFVKKNLIDRKKIKYDNLGFKGKVLLSPYSTYTKNNDELYIDVFLNKIGAIDMREYTEVKGISNLYATIQPGAIKEDRINQYVITYILGRLSKNIDYDECKEICDRIFSESFENRKKTKREYIRRIDRVKYYISSFNDFLDQIKKEKNILNTYHKRYIKKFKSLKDSRIEEFGNECFEIIIDSLNNKINNCY